MTPVLPHATCYRDPVDKPPVLDGPRPSRSADGARRLQIARELAMTPWERALRALDLGRTLKRFGHYVNR